MSALGHKQSSAAVAGMSASGVRAVVDRPKTDIAALRSAIAGKADIDPMGRDFRF